MVDEAKLVNGEHGTAPEGDGWFVLNAKDAVWLQSEDFGLGCTFEGDKRFGEVGINIRVLQPGQPACLYHSESVQEGFLVLHGECRVVIEEQVRELKPWDYVHCPPDTRHVFVGAGDGPCAILMVGARGDVGLNYPVSEVAGEFGASSAQATSNPQEAYTGRLGRTPIKSEWPL